MPAGCVIGVDLGGTKLLAGLVDGDLRTRDRAYRLAPRSEDPEEILRLIVEEVRELRARASGPGTQVTAIGVGVPSLIDRATGTAVSTVHQPLNGVPVRDRLQEQLQLPVVVDNDANCAMLAEWRAGAARGCADAVLLTVGTGIGSGVVADGRLMRGATGAATELGHMVIDYDGPRCSGACGNRGCLEALASGPALAREGTRRAAERPDSLLSRTAEDAPITGQDVTAAAAQGDRAAGEAVERIGTLLGVGIANAMNIFNPEVVLLGGGVSAAGEALLAPARAEARRRARPPSNQARVALARFGVDAGMVGAAVLAHEESA